MPSNYDRPHTRDTYRDSHADRRDTRFDYRKGSGRSRNPIRTLGDISSGVIQSHTAIVFVFILAFALILGLRLVQVTMFPTEEAKASLSQTITEPAKRGTIYDRNGVVLAADVDARTIYCNPHEVEDPEKESSAIASVLGGDANDYVDALTRENTSFSYVQRKADVDKAQQIEEMNLSGIYFLHDTKRVYPCGENAGQVVGLCDIDGKGLTGLELYYNDVLSGTDGQITEEIGSDGRTIAGSSHENQERQDGQDIVLSIDIEMQQFLEQRLAEQTQQLNGKSGNAVLYDGGTGEIIACASTPYLNPGDRENIQDGSTSLRSITTAYEPGSIFKTVSMTAIMESGVLSPDSTIYCPAYLPADEFYISDAHQRGDETMTLSHILAVSSNVGMSLAASDLGFDNLYNAIVRYNLTDYTGVDYPGESRGTLDPVDQWSQVQSYNVSFGQGIMVTPLQMCRFYGALTNGGVEETPHFLISKPGSEDQPQYESDQVIDNQQAIDEVTGMLQGVVSEGTGTQAQITGFSPAGKTGTGQYIGENGTYLENMNNISFIGYLPNTNSKLVCFVGVSEVPGDGVTTPAFRDIMTDAIQHYGITNQ